MRFIAGTALVLTLTLYSPAPALSAAENFRARDPAAKQDFTLINKSGFAVVRLELSPAEEEEWGANKLGRQRLKSGQSAEISFPPGIEACLWDLRATYDDDDTTEMNDVDLCDVATVTLNP